MIDLVEYVALLFGVKAEDLFSKDRHREGCRALTQLILLVVIVSLIVFGWVKIFNQINS